MTLSTTTIPVAPHTSVAITLGRQLARPGLHLRRSAAALAAMALWGCGAVSTTEDPSFEDPSFEELELEELEQELFAGSCGGQTNLYLAEFATLVAKELHRLDVSTDLCLENGYLKLSKTGAARCLNDCIGVQTLLDFQLYNSHDLDPAEWRQALTVNFKSQQAWDKANPGAAPPDHELIWRHSIDGGCGKRNLFRVETASQHNSSDMRIYFGHSYKCVSQGANSNQVRQQVCLNQNSDLREWELKRQSDGAFLIKNDKTGRCLTVDGGSRSEGASVAVTYCSQNNANKWLLKHQGAVERLVNKNSGKCLTVAGASYDSDAKVVQSTCNGRKEQQIIRGSSALNNVVANRERLKQRLLFAGGKANPYLEFKSTSSAVIFDPKYDLGTSRSKATSGSCVDVGDRIAHIDPSARSEGACCRSYGKYGELRQQWRPEVFFCITAPSSEQP